MAVPDKVKLKFHKVKPNSVYFVSGFNSSKRNQTMIGMFLISYGLLQTAEVTRNVSSMRRVMIKR